MKNTTQKAEERLPNLIDDICAIGKGKTAEQTRQALIKEKGYSPDELPKRVTINRIMREVGLEPLRGSNPNSLKNLKLKGAGTHGRRNKQKKTFYLSARAQALLENYAAEDGLSMSQWLEQTIRGPQETGEAREGIALSSEAEEALAKLAAEAGCSPKEWMERAVLMMAEL